MPYILVVLLFAPLSAMAEELLFRPGNLIPVSRTELKWFNNLYTQTASFDDTGSRASATRSSYLTSTLTMNYGVTSRVNLGADLNYKTVFVGDSIGKVFSPPNDANGQAGLTTLSPRFKWVPKETLPGLILSSTFVFPLRSDMEGKTGGRPFLEFNGWQWWNQILFTFNLSDAFYLYNELGAFYRFDTTLPDPKHGFSTPLKIIPHLLLGNFTFYLPLEIGPSWTGGLKWDSYYSQIGVGAKYQINDDTQVEALYTVFPIGRRAGAGSSYNLGLRYVL